MMMMMMGSSRDGEEGHQAPPPLVMRAPQQALTPNHFVFGKLLGLGSYSKVVLFFTPFFCCISSSSSSASPSHLFPSQLFCNITLHIGFFMFFCSMEFRWARNGQGMGGSGGGDEWGLVSCFVFKVFV
jgi:hypothetical protein